MPSRSSNTRQSLTWRDGLTDLCSSSQSRLCLLQCFNVTAVCWTDGASRTHADIPGLEGGFILHHTTDSKVEDLFLYLWIISSLFHFWFSAVLCKIDSKCRKQSCLLRGLRVHCEVFWGTRKEPLLSVLESYVADSPPTKPNKYLYTVLTDFCETHLSFTFPLILTL